MYTSMENELDNVENEVIAALLYYIYIIAPTTNIQCWCSALFNVDHGPQKV